MNIEFHDYSMEVKEAINSSIVKSLYEAAGEIEEIAIRKTPTDTGQLRNSWSYVVDEAKGEATIGNSQEYAIYQEFGTGEYALNGDGRKGGWFYKDAKGNGHFTHGTRPKRMLFSAFNEGKSKVIKIFEKNISSDMSKSSRSESKSKSNSFENIVKGAKRTYKKYEKMANKIEKIID